MICNRRTALRAAGGMASLLLPILGVEGAMAQTATLSSMVLISKRLDVSTQQFRDWYIQHHAPDFLSFARPYLIRYGQDFVEKSRTGVADFDCITEFGYRNHEALMQLMKILERPEAKAKLASHPRPGSKPGPHEDHGGNRTFSTDEMLIAGRRRGYDLAGTRKQAVLLKRKGDPSPGAFIGATARFAAAGAAKAQDAALRVVLDLAVPEAGRPAPLFDAVMMIWPKDNADPASLFPSPPDEMEVADIVDLICYETVLSAA